MKRRTGFLGLLTLGIAVIGSAGVMMNAKAAEAPAQKATPGYITIMWGRTNWQATTGKNCQVVPGTRTLEQNAQDMRAYGLKGTGGVVVSRTADSGISCFAGYTQQPSWQEIAKLRDVYGWSFISQGMEYKNMTLMKTDAQREYESIDTIPIMKAKGHSRAWGAFNYANNKQDDAARRVVMKGFAFGRKYWDGRNTRSVVMRDRIMSTNSVNGGRCNNPNLPCYNMKVVNNRRSTGVDKMIRVLNPGQDGWGVLQFYRLVEGKRGKIGDSFAWDCSSSDWRNRWTSQPELTCRESFLDALRGRSKTAVSVDPATVADSWGVRPAIRY